MEWLVIIANRAAYIFRFDNRSNLGNASLHIARIKATMVRAALEKDFIAQGLDDTLVLPSLARFHHAQVTVVTVAFDIADRRIATRSATSY